MSKNARYVGSVVIEMDGVEIEAINFKYDVNTGRRRVNTMNSKGRSLGYAKGIATFDLNFDVPILIDGSQDIDWASITASKFTYWPLDNPSRRKTLRDFAVETTAESSSAEGEATVSVTGFAFGEINE